MVSIHQDTTPVQKIPKKALAAISIGVRRGDPVANLEYLGLTVRTLNILENSGFGIMQLEDLLVRTPDELLDIPSVTPSVLHEIFGSLARYDQLDRAQQHMPPMHK